MSECCEENCEVEKESKLRLVINLIGLVLFVIAILYNNNISLYLYIASYILIGYDIIIDAIKNLIRNGIFDENVLMTIATVGALIIGEHMESISVLLFYKVGEYLQESAVKKAKKRIENIIILKIESCNLKVDNDIKIVDSKELNVGDIIIVKNGEKIPVDGTVMNGSSSIDMSAITGESMPNEVNVGDKVLSGSINLGMMLEVSVGKTYEKSTVQEIINIIKNSIQKKSQTEKFITRFAKVYTPIVVIIAMLLVIILPLLTSLTLIEVITRTLIFLVISCPCALVISVPLGFFIGIGESSRNGILIKGSNYLDILSNIDTVIFDKTGTLTEGVFRITETEVIDYKYTNENILEYISLAESYSNHYIAKSIISSYGKKIDKSRVVEYKEITGQGISCTIDCNKVLAGNYKLMKNNNIEVSEKDVVGTVIYLSINNNYIGNIVLSDELKEDAYDLSDKLKKLGIRKIMMLTGDKANVAEEITKKVNFDKVYSELLPKDKFEILDELKKKENRKIAYVGDGINDGPCIAASNVGISMGKGSDIAIETSDVVIITDEPSKVISAIQIAKRVKKKIVQNIAFALSVKFILLIFSIFGLTNMWQAVFADVGVSVIVIMNCLTILKGENAKKV